jgi:hypothetical protein
MILIAGFFLLFALAGVALVAGLLHLVFRLAFFPLALAAVAVKLVAVAVVGLVLLAVVGPLLLAVAVPLMILALPFLLLGAIVWAAAHAIV